MISHWRLLCCLVGHVGGEIISRQTRFIPLPTVKDEVYLATQQLAVLKRHRVIHS
jgi:hypothetical protein